jgi:DNA-binding response OmpR family regulator
MSQMPNPRVLVVDDSELIRQVISDTFSPAGYAVVTAANGLEALARINEGLPDLIIADILMPVMDGWALCEELRRSSATRDIPFIFLTTERDVPKRIKGLEMGADDYVCKPFSKEELLARAEGLLRRAGQRAGQGEAPTKAAAGAVANLSGHTSHIAMSDLLQLLSLNGRSGTLSLFGESVARVYFREGQIINAETQGLRGEKALFRIMAWPAARFDFESGEPARQVEPALRGSTSTVLMEGFTHLDELRDLIGRLPPRTRRLRVPAALAESLDTLTLTTTQRIILFAAKGRGVTLGEIIDTVPEKDLDAYVAVNDLLGRGLLEEMDEDAAK